MLFQFQLTPIDQVAPWGREGELRLSWFGLTEGWYWLQCGNEELFRYSEVLLATWAAKGAKGTGGQALPYVDYQVVRLWEDVLDMLPEVSEPIPTELLHKLEPGATARQWCGRIAEMVFAEGPAVPKSTEDRFFKATSWLGHRQLDAGHLTESPRIWFWTDGSTAFVRWDNEGRRLDGHPVWASTSGTFDLPLAAFLEEVRSFDHRLIQQMEERVHAIRRHWARPQIHIDKDGLLREQQERAAWLPQALTQVKERPPTPWDEVIEAIEFFEQSGFRLSKP